MTSVTVKVCDQCGGVIPTGAPSITITAERTNADGSTQAVGPLDFCSTADMLAWRSSQPGVPAPNSPYPQLPAH